MKKKKNFLLELKDIPIGIKIFLYIFYIVGIILFVYFVSDIVKIYNKDNIKIVGEIISYETIVNEDTEIQNKYFYKEVVKYELNGEEHIYTNINKNSLVPIVGSNYTLMYNEKSGEVISGEFFDSIFTLLLAPSLFILVPTVFLLALMGKEIKKFIGFIFAFISFLVVLYFVNGFGTWNYVYIIVQNPWAIIPIIMFIAGCYTIASAIIYNGKRPHYIKMKLEKIEENNDKFTAYFSAGLISGFQAMFLYKFKDNGDNFFEIDKKYKVNIAILGSFSARKMVNMSKLKRKAFIKID